MAIPAPAAVLSHWCKLLENFQASPLEFYSLIEESIKRRQVPDIEVSRIDWNEGGVFSAKREYLRVARGKHIFDICGAPFGSGFFVSSWFVRPQNAPWPVALFLLVMGMALFLGLMTKVFGLFLAPPAFVILFPLAFWAFVQFMNEKKDGWDESIVAIPIFGAIYQRIFRPETYYRIDTITMFQQAIHNSVLEAVDAMTSGSGTRALTELERRPTLMRLGASANG